MSSQPSILGHYKVERTLGTGAMGVVYEGTDLKLHRKVAIKTFRKDEHGELATDYSNRFLREAQAVARLNHPHIVQVYDFGEEDDMSFIVMELIQGTNLKAAFEETRFPLAETVRIMAELLDALDFAHRAGIIHRDIKPANIMLDRQRRTKLTDFGVARLMDLERTSGERTQAGTIVGTPAYMSPEQVQGQAIDHRSDIFSAGVVLYQLLTGRKPFDGGAYTISKRIVESEPPRPSSLVQSISPAWDSVVSRAMAKIPERRFSRAKEFAEAMRRAVESAPPEVDQSAETVIRPDAAAESRKPSSTQSRPAQPEEGRSPTASGTNTAQHSEAELEFWRSVRESDDPDDLDLYVEKFPAGLYVDLARRKAAKLRRPPGASEEDSDIRTRETEDEVWRSVKDSADADDIEFYVEKFPNGRYVELARRKITKLRRTGSVGEDSSGSRGVVAEAAQREAAQREADQRAEKEAAERARIEAQERARKQAEAEAQAKREEEVRARREADEKAKREAEEKSRREAEERERREAQARREAEERALRDAEERARREAEEKTRREAQERKRRDAEAAAAATAAAAAAAKAEREAQEQARREAEEAQRREAAEARRRESDEARRRELQEKQRQADVDLERRAAAERAKQAAEAAAAPASLAAATTPPTPEPLQQAAVSSPQKSNNAGRIAAVAGAVAVIAAIAYFALKSDAPAPAPEVATAPQPVPAPPVPEATPAAPAEKSAQAAAGSPSPASPPPTAATPAGAQVAKSAARAEAPDAKSEPAAKAAPPAPRTASTPSTPERKAAERASPKAPEPALAASKVETPAPPPQEPPRTEVAAAAPTAAAPPEPPAMRLITRVEPKWPREAVLNNIEGRVKARLTLDARGKVTDVVVVDATPRRIFDRNVIDALLQWRYNEGAAGRTIETEITFRR